MNDPETEFKRRRAPYRIERFEPDAKKKKEKTVKDSSTES